MIFEKVKRFADKEITLPVRKTTESAGYDFYIAEKIIVPAYYKQMNSMLQFASTLQPLSLNELGTITKNSGIKPVLAPTGVKCKLNKDEYLELAARSSTPLKYWLIVPNAPGIIDADYYSNESNDGEIFIQLINLSPFDIVLNPGDCIAQGIVKKYISNDDAVIGQRVGGFGSTN